MPDFGAILRKAREGAASAGATGAAGAGSKFPLQNRGRDTPEPGPGSLYHPGPPGPHIITGPGGPSPEKKPGPAPLQKWTELKQSLSEGGPAGPGGPSEKQHVCNFQAQADLNRCFVCGGREEAERLFVAVLTDRLGAHHWLHHDCHAEHSSLCAEARASRQARPEIRASAVSDA